MAPIYKSCFMSSGTRGCLDGQPIAFVKGQSVSKNYFSLCKNISSASCMCVEGRLKQEKIQGCWFVDGKVPSIRMQVKWETFL